jgi:four helix bundle protein
MIGGGMARSLVAEKSYSFALKIISLYREMQGERERTLSRQLLKAGTSIGANVEEARAAQSRADFLSKMSIASKEARETRYWLRLLRDSQMVGVSYIEELLRESEELVSMLTAIVKTTDQNNTRLKAQKR